MMDNKQRTILVLLSIFTVLVLYKVFVLDYSPATILPENGYKMHIVMEVDGHGSEVNVRASLPLTDKRQTIFRETGDPSDFNFTIHNKDGNRFGVWQNYRLEGNHVFSYSFNVKSKKVVYNLPEHLKKPLTYGRDFRQYLESTDLIQVGDQDIINTLALMGLDQNSDVIFAVNKIYEYISRQISNAGFSGKTDALTTLRLAEASCNGKSRLFAAMSRTLGIPARLVGGVVLNAGKKKISHQWVDVFIGDSWVPMDPTNKHYAMIPENYLIFYYGDEPFFQRTSNVNFKYYFDIETDMFPRESDYSSLAAHPLNIMNAWELFQKAGLSLDLLRIILMIPVGAVVTIIFRNVIGLRTFGTFLPALIASAFRGSGLLWGMVAFMLIIVVGSLLRSLLERLRITHTPKLTILLVYVVFALLSVSGLGVYFNNMSLAKATLFPLALMAITIERFALLAQESGTREAYTIFANTAVTVFFCYLVINSLFLQTIVLAFPETMLLVICAGIYFGNWVGIRVTELIRFRGLIFDKGKV
ncbi:MAG: transglutaminase [Calditrichales bacterium]|nr:MAG: transglutaminase [Calditrichales bacterium]